MKNKKIVTLTIILALMVLVFGLLNRESVDDKKHLYENAEILIKGEEREVKFNRADIKELGEVEFSADLKSSGKMAEKQNYTGVSLEKILGKAEIEVKKDKRFIVRAIDGYTVTLEPEEIMDKDNVYLAYEMNGEYLSSEEGGPYQLIIRKDKFSQRWCKNVVEIILDE